MKFGNKVRNSIKKEFDSEPTYDEKCLRTKMKSYKAKINTNFLIINNKGRLAMYLINSFFKTGKNSYPQVFLEEYISKKKRQHRNFF